MVQQSVPPGSVASRPAAARRGFAVLVGFVVEGGAIAGGLFGGAGVTTSPSDTSSGPTPASWLLLVLVGVLMAAGAALVARNASAFPPPPAASAGPNGRFPPLRRVGGRIGLFCSVLGGALLLLGLGLPLDLRFGISEGLFPPTLAPSVLFVPASLDGLGLALIAGGIVAFLRERRLRPALFRAWWRRAGRPTALGAILLVGLFTALLAVPVPHTFSMQLVLFGNGVGALVVEEFPRGAVVSGSWYSTSGSTVNMAIEGPNGMFYSVNASSGTFSFTAQGIPWAAYDFLAVSDTADHVAVSGSFSAPIWQWPPGEPGAPT